MRIECAVISNKMEDRAVSNSSSGIVPTSPRSHSHASSMLQASPSNHNRSHKKGQSNANDDINKRSSSNRSSGGAGVGNDYKNKVGEAKKRQSVCIVS